MNIKPIKNEKDYKAALKEVDLIFDAKPGTSEGDRLEILVTLIEAFERKSYELAPPDPIEAIKFRMEQLELKPSDLSEVLGGRNRVSEILNRKRGLTVKMMKALRTEYDVPAESLLA